MTKTTSGGKRWHEDIRIAILARDNHECRRCGSRDDLCVAYEPSVGRVNMEDLEARCRKCTGQVAGSRGGMIRRRF